MSQWVQHISGQGAKWRVFMEEPLKWCSHDRSISIGLPKSEYRLCDPPEQWVDVTAECEICSDGKNMKLARIDFASTDLPFGYRFVKKQFIRHPATGEGGLISVWAFTVEKRV